MSPATVTLLRLMVRDETLGVALVENNSTVTMERRELDHAVHAVNTGTHAHMHAHTHTHTHTHTHPGVMFQAVVLVCYH